MDNICRKAKISLKIVLTFLLLCLSLSFRLNAIADEKDNVLTPTPEIRLKIIGIYTNAPRQPRLVIQFYPVTDYVAEKAKGSRIQEYRIYKDGRLFERYKPDQLYVIIHLSESKKYIYEYTEFLPERKASVSHKEYVDAMIAEGHYYAISAVDIFGNESSLSEKIPITSFKVVPLPPEAFCFAKNTLVLMADNNLNFIQDIRLGDQLASYDFKTSRLSKAEVKRIRQEITHSYLIINGLMVTEKHPFAVGPDDWIEAGDLKVGDIVKGRNDEIVIKEITKVNENLDVFDLTLSTFFNFYVFNGESFFLVHNKD